MKQLNWKKWGLASFLLLALASNLSFNPETKTIARNDGITSGVYALAIENAPSIKINLGDYDEKYKGVEVQAYLTANKDSATFIVKKVGEMNATTEASFCAVCVGTSTLALAEIVRNNEDLLKAALAKKAIEDIVAKKKKKSEEERIARRKTEDLYESECAEEDEDDIVDLARCQADELEDLVTTCVDKAEDDRVARRDEAEKRREKRREAIRSGRSERRSRTSRVARGDLNKCQRLVRNYYRDEMKSVIRDGLSAEVGSQEYVAARELVSLLKSGIGGLSRKLITPDISSEIDRMARQGQVKSAEKYFTQIYNREYRGLTVGLRMPETQAQKLALDTARMKTTGYLSQVSAFDLDIRNRDGLGYLSSLLTRANRSDMYVDNFQTEYATPISTLTSGLMTSNKNYTDLLSLLKLYEDSGSVVPAVPGSTNGTTTTTPVIGNPGRPRIGLTNQGLPAATQTVQTINSTTTTPARSFPGPRLGQ
jgi:hypothetical protein